MPYDPYAPTAETRSWPFIIMWLGLLGTVISLVQYLIDPDVRWMSIPFGLMCAGLANAAYPDRADDYFRAQCNFAMRWSIGLVAVYTFALFILRMYDIAYVTGFRSVSDGEIERIPMGFSGYANDATLFAMLVALTFYGAFAFAMLRDRFTAGGDGE